jgi:hypothetical protein
MEKQTATQMLIENLRLTLPKAQFNDWLMQDLFKEALEIEKEQTIEFAKKCLDKALDLDIRTAYSKVEQYYNETYGETKNFKHEQS